MKRIFLILVSFFFRFSLFFGLTLLALVLVVGNKNTFKQTLGEVGAYERFTQSVIDSSKNSGNNNPNSIPLGDPQIQEIIRQSLDTKSLSSISEGFIDSGFAWLNGETEDVEFSADLTTNKQVLADGVANYAVNRIASLDPCETPPTDTSVFTVECNPTGIDLGELKQDISKTIFDDKTVFSNNRLTLDNLPKTSSGLAFTEQYADFPKYFQIIKVLPYIILSIASACAVIIIFTARTRRRGLKTVGYSLITTAVIMAITPLIYIYVLPAIGFGAPNFNSNDQSVSSIVNDGISKLYSAFNIMIINVALQTLVVGFVLVIIAKFLKSKSSIYINLEKKTGLIPSESPKKQNISNDLSDMPVQTSEAPVKKTKKTSALEKKYRKM